MKIKTVTVYKKEDFYNWLVENYKKEIKINIIFYKKHSDKFSLTHREQIEMAICFGWIDTTIKRIDEDRYMRSFSKRNKNSRWSNNTLSYGKKLIKEGIMTEEGLKFYKLGKSKPTLDHGIPKNPKMPAELEKELAKSKKIKLVFDLFSPSKKKMLYRCILRAKLSETKKRQIDKIIEEIKIKTMRNKPNH